MRTDRRHFLKLGSAAFAWVALSPWLDAAGRPGAEFLVKGVAKPGTPLPYDDAAEAGALRFLVLGDWGKLLAYKKGANGVSEPTTSAGRGQLAVANAMADWAAKHSPAFVLSVGDNFYETGVKSATDPRWRLTFEEVYAAASLQVPWYVALGNHDHYGNAQAQLDYAATSKRWRMPARHYTFVEKSPSGVSVEFFVLDTDPFARAVMGKSAPDAEAAAQQLVWLDAALKASKATWKIVVGHHPLWTGGTRRATREHRLADELPPILRRHDVAVYLCGHEHDAQHLMSEGVHCLLVGNSAEAKPTGAIDKTVYAESFLGFAHASVTADRFQIHFVDTLGKIRHTAAVKRPTR